MRYLSAGKYSAVKMKTLLAALLAVCGIVSAVLYWRGEERAFENAGNDSSSEVQPKTTPDSDDFSPHLVSKPEGKSYVTRNGAVEEALMSMGSSLSDEPLDSKIGALLSGSSLIGEDGYELSSEQLGTLFGLLGDMEFLPQWPRITYLMCMNGESDVATSHLLEFIEFHKEPVDATAGVRSEIYMARLKSIFSLGVTRGKRAENFLVRAYTDIRDVSVVKQLHELSQEEQESIVPATFRMGFDIDAIGMRSVISALLLFDDSRFSDMIQRDYRTLRSEVEGIRVNYPVSGSSRYSIEDESKLVLFGTYVDCLVQRDIIRKIGPRAFFDMSEDEYLERMMAGLHTYDPKVGRWGM